MGRRTLTLSAVATALIASATAFALPASATGLTGGHRGSYSWAVALERRGGTASTDRGQRPSPCLRVAITIRHGPLSYGRTIFRDCVASPAGLRRGGPPLLVGGSQLGHSDRAGMTVFGILAPGSVLRVHLTFSDGAEANARLLRLSDPAAGVAGRRGLRYAVLALPGAHCVERLATHGGGDGVIWEGAPEGHSCSAEAG